jgi:hypothetical protein
MLISQSTSKFHRFTNYYTDLPTITMWANLKYKQVIPRTGCLCLALSIYATSKHEEKTGQLLKTSQYFHIQQTSAYAGVSNAEVMDKMLGFVSKTHTAYIELRIHNYIFILLHKTLSLCINVHPEIHFNLFECKY